MTQHEINLRAQAQAGALAPHTMAAIKASARYTSYLIDKADFDEGLPDGTQCAACAKLYKENHS